jgi:hypothetical protein
VKRPRDRPADAARGAGNEGRFAGQIEHAVILFLFATARDDRKRLDHEDTTSTKEEKEDRAMARSADK